MSDELLTSHRILSSIIGSDPTIQREHVFYTKCAVQSKICTLIIDGGSCINVAGQYMVEKLGLITTSHPHPYQLRGLNDKGEIRVKDQVQVSFKIGNYVDTVTCDVIPMLASHLVFGQPWIFDRKAARNDETNEHTITHKGRRFRLLPMTPDQVKEMIKTSPQICNWVKLNDSVRKEEQAVRDKEAALLLVSKEGEGKHQPEADLSTDNQQGKEQGEIRSKEEPLVVAEIFQGGGNNADIPETVEGDTWVAREQPPRTFSQLRVVREFDDTVQRFLIKEPFEESGYDAVINSLPRKGAHPARVKARIISSNDTRRLSLKRRVRNELDNSIRDKLNCEKNELSRGILIVIAMLTLNQ